MLQIFERGKVTSFFLGNESRIPREDIITGAVFGILEYVDTNTALRMLRILLGENAPADIPNAITKLTCTFWERSLHSNKRGWIEPDALIDFMSGRHHRLRIIVEAKYGSGLSPDQAPAQWNRFSGEAEQTWHFFPVDNVDRIESQLEKEDKRLSTSDGFNQNVWKRSRWCRSWANIAQALAVELAKGGQAHEPHLRRWLAGVRSVLRSFGEKSFEGFSRLPIVSSPSVSKASRVFWQGPVLLRAFDWPTPPDGTPQNRIFFKPSRT